jgi:hypothetical protein
MFPLNDTKLVDSINFFDHSELTQPGKPLDCLAAMNPEKIDFDEKSHLPITDPDRSTKPKEGDLGSKHLLCIINREPGWAICPFCDEGHDPSEACFS